LRDTIIKNKAARDRLERWYQRFLERIPVKTGSREIETSFGKTHLLTMGDPSKPPLVCLHSMMTSSAHLATELVALLDNFYIIAPDIPGQSVRGLPVRLPNTTYPSPAAR
jgi:2-hydroxy-6-oxonona-2,4-dienedioate hydrolase